MAVVVTILDTTLKEIADAIRAKTGGTTQYLPSEMAKAILSISSGGGTTPTPANTEKTIYKKVVKTDSSGASENWDATEDFEFTVPSGTTKVKLISSVKDVTFEFVDGEWSNPVDITVGTKGTIVKVQAGRTYRFCYWVDTGKANQSVTFSVTCGGDVESATANSATIPVFA